ncbi:MAG: sigma-70 family RNA polymerase sigma factor [Spirochaetales bacterium]|nr:sigma-70 family RNA polymerase sigma factor [Spirochaetales bacterium]
MDDKKERYPEEGAVLTSIQEILNGNKEAFSVIVNQFTPLLYSLSYRMLGNQAEAEEAVQDIFLKTYKSLNLFKLSKRFYPWIYTIAINYLRTLLKKRKSRKQDSALTFNESIGVTQNNRPLTPDPLEYIAQKETEEMAQAALAGLKTDYREVFILREIEGLSVAETADVLKIPEGTVKTNLFRAKQILIKKIVQNETKE